MFIPLFQLSELGGLNEFEYEEMRQLLHASITIALYYKNYQFINQLFYHDLGTRSLLKDLSMVQDTFRKLLTLKLSSLLWPGRCLNERHSWPKCSTISSILLKIERPRCVLLFYQFITKMPTNLMSSISWGPAVHVSGRLSWVACKTISKFTSFISTEHWCMK